MPLFLPDPTSPLHHGEMELDHETRIFEAQEAALNSTLLQEARRAQAQEQERIKLQTAKKTCKHKRTAEPTAAESSTKGEQFKAMLMSKEQGTKKEKEEWPGLNTLVSHHCFYFHPHVY
jgi:hypothetical protein